MFLPTTRDEMDRLGWDRPDVVLVTGDSYIDSPYIGIAVIGNVLRNAGFRVGVIAQPDTDTERDISRLGEPRLFWGISGGCIDSMIANYTSLKKPRKGDDYTPGGINSRRPDRAVIVYANLVRRYFKDTRPLVLGGIEASLRRVAHYDFWSDRVRSSILFDAKADYLLYGMAENAVIQLASALKEGADPHSIRGLCYIAREGDTGETRSLYTELPSYDVVSRDKLAFTAMFHTFYRNNDAMIARGLYQQHGNRYLIHNPPALSMKQAELDGVYGLDYERAQHPYYERQGKVKALETIRFSIPTHRGCYGECNFCAIAVHEGRTVQWRSEESILREASQIAALPDFKGYIMDLGGPTANMYGIECNKKLHSGACQDRRCLYPEICPSLKVDHHRQLELLKKVRAIPGVKKVFIASGIRYDMVLDDVRCRDKYMEELVEHHVSGQMKVAPEHTEDTVLSKMGKPGAALLLKFKTLFDQVTKKAGMKQFLTYYLVAAHPGCTMEDMKKLKGFASRELRLNPEQVQVFLPAPSTYSALMYYTEVDPFTGDPLFVEKDPRGREQQKALVVAAETPGIGKKKFRS